MNAPSQPSPPSHSVSQPQVPNTLGKASLVLGILSSTLVFSVGMCAGLGQQQGWLPAVGPLLFLLGSTFCFLGLIAVLLGVGGLFGRNRSRATAIFGLLLGVAALFLFAAILNGVQGAH
jgi:riboflavin transporter FmnP